MQHHSEHRIKIIHLTSKALSDTSKVFSYTVTLLTQTHVSYEIIDNSHVAFGCSEHVCQKWIYMTKAK